jgi:hypothetical protein
MFGGRGGHSLLGNRLHIDGHNSISETFNDAYYNLTNITAEFNGFRKKYKSSLRTDWFQQYYFGLAIKEGIFQQHCNTNGSNIIKLDQYFDYYLYLFIKFRRDKKVQYPSEEKKKLQSHRNHPNTTVTVEGIEWLWLIYYEFHIDATVRDAKMLLAKQLGCCHWQISIYREGKLSNPLDETIFLSLVKAPLIAKRGAATWTIPCNTISGKPFSIIIDPRESVERLEDIALNELHKQAPNTYPLTSRFNIVSGGRFLNNNQLIYHAGLKDGACVLLLPSPQARNYFYFNVSGGNYLKSIAAIPNARISTCAPTCLQSSPPVRNYFHFLYSITLYRHLIYVLL